MNNTKTKERLSTLSSDTNAGVLDILELWAATFNLCEEVLREREILVECAFCIRNLTISGREDALIHALKIGIDWAVKELPRRGTLICTSTRDEAGRALLTVTCGEVDTTFEHGEDALKLLNADEGAEDLKELPNTEYWRGRDTPGTKDDESAMVYVEALAHGGTRLVYAFPVSRAPLY